MEQRLLDPGTSKNVLKRIARNLKKPDLEPVNRILQIETTTGNLHSVDKESIRETFKVAPRRLHCCRIPNDMARKNTLNASQSTNSMICSWQDIVESIEILPNEYLMRLT